MRWEATSYDGLRKEAESYGNRLLAGTRLRAVVGSKEMAGGIPSVFSVVDRESGMRVLDPVELSDLGTNQDQARAEIDRAIRRALSSPPVPPTQS